MEQPPSIYHERQSRQLCLLHSLNSLFQCKAFQKEDLNLICETLSPNNFINPHKSPIGFGNYDINVLYAALDMKGHEALWFDKRKSVSLLDLNKIFGFILNVPVQRNNLLHYMNPFTYFGDRRHWIACRKINSIWYNLDSKLIKPKQIGSDDKFLEFLSEKCKDADCQVFIIAEKSLKGEVYLTC